MREEDGMETFVKGKKLCRQFFEEIAKPVLEQYFPGLSYSAGLLGYGSDVLGYDDPVSTDHMWGPRFYLFLKPDDMDKKEGIMKHFSRELPYTYQGYSVNFSEPNIHDHGVRQPVFITEGLISPLIFIQTSDDFLNSYLGCCNWNALSNADWLSFSEHRLLALTSGEFYQDDLGIKKYLEAVSYFPNDVWLYQIASNWSLIAEEQAFVGRCIQVGDEIGSILVCARIAERLMRLGFLYCRTYAPYSKWFGTAFSNLPLDRQIKEEIRRALCAQSGKEREIAIVRAQKMMADLHNEKKITEAVPVEITNYFGRSIKVIFADRIADTIKKKLVGTSLEGIPLIGSFSGVENFTAFSDDTSQRMRRRKVFEKARN